MKAEKEGFASCAHPNIVTHVIRRAGTKASRGVERQGDNSVCNTSQRTHSTQLVTAEPAGPRTHPSPPSEIEHEGSERERRLTTGYRYSQSHYEFSLPLAFLTTGSSNSHYRLIFSLPDLGILTTACCCHYQNFEFSLPLAVVTTRASNSHYRLLFSLPIQHRRGEEGIALL